MAKEKKEIEKLFTLKEAQEILRVSRPTIYRMREDGRLPVISIGQGRKTIYRVTESSLKKLTA